MADPTCDDEFDDCELEPNHAGDHQKTTEAGVVRWSDPLPHPPTDDDDEYDEDWDD